MATINGIEVIDRHNRPGVLQRNMLRLFFTNNGAFTDPYEISSVTVHTLAQNSSPSSVLTSANVVSATPLMGFATSDGTDILGTTFAPSNYSPGATASGIFRLGVGEYAVVLDGTVNASGQFQGSTIANEASSVGTYVDIWTVKLTSGADYQVFIQQFELFNDTFITFTQPLLVRAKSTLFKKHWVLGTKENLMIGTDITIGNKDMSPEDKNILKDSAITSAMVQIKKKNHGNTLQDYTVSSFANTSALVDITSDNTIVLNWNTDDLNSIASNSGGAMGNSTGEYTIQVKFDLLNQTILSQEMPIIIRAS